MLPAAYALFDRLALQNNIQRVRELAAGVKIMAVIKANAYGHGMLQVAEQLGNVDALAVARVEEGKRLREIRQDNRIVVLEGFVNQEELALCRKLSLEPVLHTEYQLDLIAMQAGSPLGVWIKLDTGMHRLGFDPEQLAPVMLRLRNNPQISRINFMTHLANADMLDDPMTGLQIERFREWSGIMPEAEKSIANSAGILAWPRSHADWVRPGILLYGASPFPGRTGSEDGLQPVMTFCSRLIAVKFLRKGEAIGYGGTWRAEKDKLIGVVAVGYGDGYPRHAQSGTPVLVNNQRVSLVGRVSMDMLSVDLSECPDAQPGDPVVLWGKGLPVEEVAENAATIPYTLLCGITQRVRFFEAGSVVP